MKKNKVYSASDFVGCNVSVVVESSKWLVDHVSFTKEGSVTAQPLFKVELRQYVRTEADEDGFIDATQEMLPNRTYFAREGRSMYTELYKMYKASEGDVTDFDMYVAKNFANKYYRGRVEQLSGICYTVKKKDVTLTKSKLELWYPDTIGDDSVILGDFIHLCNKGVYTPVIQETPDPVMEALKNLDPAVIAAIKAMK